jgi:hypothetical protein
LTREFDIHASDYSIPFDEGRGFKHWTLKGKYYDHEEVGEEVPPQKLREGRHRIGALA